MLDSLHRPMQALRLSVTDRCNFRCGYCMPSEVFPPDHAFLSREDLLTFEELEIVVRAAVGLGVDKVRLTGGEPTLRKGLVSLVARLRDIAGLRTLALTTNGSTLVTLARPLKDAGLDRLTVSLDTLDAQQFARLSDTTVPLQQVLDGLDAAREAGFQHTKLNCVLQRGVNEEAILPLADFARNQGLELRFIEFMDVGTANAWNLERVVSAAEVAQRLHAVWPMDRMMDGPNCVAQHWRYRDGRGSVGLIASVTEPFCRGCDRVRLSAEGRLYTCLFAAEGLDLRAHLRAGASQDTLQALMAARWRRRDDRYSERRSEATVGGERPEMFRLGG